MTTKEEKAARWPWRIDRIKSSRGWCVNRRGIDSRFDLLRVEYSVAAAIYAIAKTQE